jgi:hypothetical protein
MGLRGRWLGHLQRDVGELGETEAAKTGLRNVGSDGEPDVGVGGGSRRAPGGGDGDARVVEHAAGISLTAGGGEAEQDPVGVPGGGQAGVARQFAGETVEGFGAVVVLDEERQGSAVLAPDAVAVGADDFAPLAGATPLGPPLVEVAAGPGAGRAEQTGEEAVEADEVGQALAGREVVGQPPPPRQVREVDAGLGRDEGGAQGAEDPVERGRAAPTIGVGTGRRCRGRTARPGASLLGVPR